MTFPDCQQCNGFTATGERPQSCNAHPNCSWGPIDTSIITTDHKPWSEISKDLEEHKEKIKNITKLNDD